MDTNSVGLDVAYVKGNVQSEVGRGDRPDRDWTSLAGGVSWSSIGA